MLGDTLRWGYKFIKCPICGRRLKIRIGQKYRFCPYCKKEVKVKK